MYTWIHCEGSVCLLIFGDVINVNDLWRENIHPKILWWTYNANYNNKIAVHTNNFFGRFFFWGSTKLLFFMYLMSPWKTSLIARLVRFSCKLPRTSIISLSFITKTDKASITVCSTTDHDLRLDILGCHAVTAIDTQPHIFQSRRKIIILVT